MQKKSENVAHAPDGIRVKKPENFKSLGEFATDTPESRAIQANELERIVQIPQLGGLHHRYERRAA
jgi:hypothetical protein